MARRPRLFAAGVLYHVIVRGNQRQKTFTAESDYQAYIERLARYRKKYDYVLHAYCLMPNHVHLLVESSEQPLAKFMQGLQQSYSQYFNLRHRKTGHVFVLRFSPRALETLRSSNVVESPFSRVRLRTTASRRFKSQVNATCLIWKTLMIAELSFRKLDAPQLVDKVARGQKYANGQEVRVAA